MRVGYKHSPETIEKIRAALTGNTNKRGQHLSAETKEKIRVANLGRRNSPEAIEKMRQALKGRKPSPQNREAVRRACLGNKFALGKKLSEETKAKMSAARKGKPKSAEWRKKLSLSHLGEKNYNWRGGKSKVQYPSGWLTLTRKIRDRDNHLCQHPRCYSPETLEAHHVHHIDFNKSNVSPENLITLCRGHHVSTYFGEAEYWVEFYSAVQNMRGFGGV